MSLEDARARAVQLKESIAQLDERLKTPSGGLSLNERDALLRARKKDRAALTKLVKKYGLEEPKITAPENPVRESASEMLQDGTGGIKTHGKSADSTADTAGPASSNALIGSPTGKVKPELASKKHQPSSLSYNGKYYAPEAFQAGLLQKVRQATMDKKAGKDVSALAEDIRRMRTLWNEWGIKFPDEMRAYVEHQKRMDQVKPGDVVMVPGKGKAVVRKVSPRMLSVSPADRPKSKPYRVMKEAARVVKLETNGGAAKEGKTADAPKITDKIIDGGKVRVIDMPPLLSNIERQTRVLLGIKERIEGDLFNPKETTIHDALRKGKVYYESLMHQEIHGAAFHGERVYFTDLGWNHIAEPTLGARHISEKNRIRRIALLRKAKAIIEHTPYVDEIRPESEGTTFGLLGRFKDGSVVRVSVQKVRRGSKEFLTVFDLADVEKKIKKVSIPDFLPSDIDGPRVGMAPSVDSKNIFGSSAEKVKLEDTANVFSGENSPIKISSDAFGKGLDAKSIKTRAFQYAKDFLFGRSVYNLDKGVTININRTGIRKALGGDLRKAIIIKELPKVLSNAKYRGFEFPSDHNAQNIKAFHRFEAYVFLDGKPETIGLLVREDQNGHFHYNHHVIDPEKAPTGTPALTDNRSNLPTVSMESSRDNYSIGSSAEKVKSENTANVSSPSKTSNDVTLSFLGTGALRKFNDLDLSEIVRQGMRNIKPVRDFMHHFGLADKDPHGKIFTAKDYRDWARTSGGPTIRL